MESTIQFLTIVLFLEVLPGPAVLFVLFQSSVGLRYAFVGILGLLTANVIWISLVASGLGLVLKSSPVAFGTMKWFGAAYLAYLGFKIAKNGISSSPDTDGGLRQSYWQAYLQGMLTSFSNPKALLFFMALLPSFVSESNFAADILYFGGLKMLCLFIVMGSYALVGQRFFDFLKSSTLASVVSKTLGAGIILAAIGVAKS